MRANVVIFWIIAIYFLVVGVAYTVWNMLEHGRLEWTGTLALYGSGILNGFIAFYLGLVQKKAGGVYTEDLPDADIDDGDPEVGEFSPWSWWPVMLAGACSLFLLGLAIGFNFWLSYFSVPLIVLSIVGWVYEYYRGHFAR